MFPFVHVLCSFLLFPQLLFILLYIFVILFAHVVCIFFFNLFSLFFFIWFTTTCAISAHHHQSCEFESCSWQGVFDTLHVYDKVCQWLATGLCFSPGTDLTEILLKVELNTIILTLTLRLLYPPQRSCRGVYWFHHVRPSVHL